MQKGTSSSRSAAAGRPCGGGPRVPAVVRRRPYVAQRLAVPYTFFGKKRLQNVGFSATHFKMRDFPPRHAVDCPVKTARQGMRDANRPGRKLVSGHRHRLSRQEVIARDAIVIPSGKKPVVRDSIAVLSSKKPAWDTCQMTSRQQACRCPIEPSVRARLRA